MTSLAVAAMRGLRFATLLALSIPCPALRAVVRGSGIQAGSPGAVYAAREQERPEGLLQRGHRNGDR